MHSVAIHTSRQTSEIQMYYGSQFQVKVQLILFQILLNIVFGQY